MTGYPVEFAQRYRAAGYWIGQTHAEMLAESVAARPDQVAVLDRRRVLTYAELLDNARRLAHGFVDAGWARGDRVVIQMPNIVEYLEVVFGLFDAGLVPVFALASHGRNEIDDLVARSGARAYITVDAFGAIRHGEIAAEIADAHPDVTIITAEITGGTQLVGRALDHYRRPHAGSSPTPSTNRSTAADAIAFLQLSGGTTGTPKLIGRTHDDYLYSVRESARICGLTDRSVYGVVLPVSHNFTMSSPGVLGALYAGSTIVMIGSADPDTVFGAVGQHRITQLSAVPPLVAAWVDSPVPRAHDISSLEVIGVGGAKLSRTLAERIPEVFGARLQQVFGMAEGLVNYTRLDDDDEVVVATQGRPISPDDEIRVVDSQGLPVPDGTAGSLQTRGPYTIREYWGGQSPESFTDDGFYRTGDIVVRRPDGNLQVVGRDKDQINRAGEKIAPEEIENLLLTHPAIRDASVVGAADDRLGERIVAYVIGSETSGAALPDAFGIRGHLRELGLARFKIPDEIHVVDEFPTTAVGKVSKNVQRDDARPVSDAVQNGAAPEIGDDRRAVLDDLAAKLAVDVDSLPGAMALSDTGIDSLQLMALLDHWRSTGAVGLDFEVLAQSETIDDLVAGVLTARTRRGH